jgi:transcriptional regulator with XRE-family HTH domain
MNAFELSIAVRAFRDNARLTDREAAAALGIAYGTFCRYKNQWGAPKPQQLAEIERRLRAHAIVTPLDLPPEPEPITIAPAEFAAALVAWRQRGGLTQRAVAAALGVSVNTLRHWERCMKTPHTSTLQRIVPILNSPPGEQPPPPPRISRRLDPEFGPRLRAWRKASRLKQAQVCAMLGISDKATLSHYERGRAMPCDARLAKIEQIIARGPALSASAHADISFPQRLRAWRRGRGLKQTQACALLGVDVSLLSDYERGDALPRPERRAQIEAIIGGAGAIAPALAEIERMRAKLARWRESHARREARLQRQQRAIERLARTIERRQCEASSLSLLP